MELFKVTQQICLAADITFFLCYYIFSFLYITLQLLLKLIDGFRCLTYFWCFSYKMQIIKNIYSIIGSYIGNVVKVLDGANYPNVKTF